MPTTLRRLPAFTLAAALAACTQTPAEPAPSAETPAPAAPYAAAKPKDPGADWTFDFKDPPDGKRGAIYTAFGATVGTSMFAEVDALVQRLGLDCGNTSIRAMMDSRREKEKKRVEEAKARGEDAVTSASWVNRRSKREANPQIRFSCTKVGSDKIGDRPRVESIGRLLFVFDSPDYPVRHVSYQRSAKDGATALADFKDTIAALTKIYGPPTKPLVNELPTPDKDGVVEFPNAINYDVAWEFSDLLVRTNVLRYGKIVSVGERVEVPHGLRPDAPHVGAGVIDPPPAAAKPTTGTPATPDARAPSPTPG